MSLNAAAVRFLEKLGHEDLRPMLGLVAEDGTVPPDDTNVYNFPPADRGPGAINPDAFTAMPRPARDRSAVPPGLLHLAPEIVEEAPKKRRGPKPQPKVIRPSKPRELQPCGTVAAYSRHRRRGEEVDDACREANRAYGRDKHQTYRDRLRREQAEKERARLLAEGVNPQSATVLSEAMA